MIQTKEGFNKVYISDLKTKTLKNERSTFSIHSPIAPEYMQSSFKILFLLLFPFLGLAQPSSTSQAQTVPDSLRQILTSTNNDSTRYQACRLLYTYYEERNRDSALHYADQRLLLSRKNNKRIPEALSLIHISEPTRPY